MQSISIDIETRSSVDLGKCGVYKYVESPDFDILLFGYSVDGGEVQVVDLACGRQIPEEVLQAIVDESVLKWAYNASFERICLSTWIRKNRPDLFRSYNIPEDTVGNYLDPRSWRCSLVWSAYLGLPLSLQGVGAVLKLEDQKMTEGKALIRYFCMPCKPTNTNGGRTWNLPEHAPDKWAVFKEYNKRDVEVEMAIQKKLSAFPVPDSVWDEYHLSEEINDRGIALDREMVRQAIALDDLSRDELSAEMQRLTQMDNPNSVAQMKQWLADHGMEVESLDKKAVKELLKTAPPELAKALELRQQLARSSVKKYIAMENCVCADGRCRGMFQFYGANRSGRWAGRLVQLQNLPQNHIPDLAAARNLVKAGDYEMLRLLYEDVPDTLSQLIRTAFVPKPGYKFIVSDFSAIEARVLAWLAGEQWVLDVFAAGGDIYCETASRMFHVPVEKHGINSHLRAKGKQAVLSCGYSGGASALKAMGAIEAGMKEEELQPLVTAWREANPNIVQLWWDVDTSVRRAVQGKTSTKTHGLVFTCESGMLFITLPSGRKLAYVKPKLGVNRFGGASVTYEGVGATKKWERIESWGGKLVENCIAASTPVLTDQGLVPIEKVTADMLVWDGVEWVRHDGLIMRGTQPTLDVDGIHMTSNHKILTEKGWIRCEYAEGLNWADISLPYSYTSSKQQSSRKDTMALSLRVWAKHHTTLKGIYEQKESCEILRLYERQTDFCGQPTTWNEPSSGLWGMAFDETTMYGPKPSCLSQLWWAWYNGVRKVAKKLRELLVRYGANMEKGSRFGQNRQQCRVQPRKLPVDNSKTECSEPEKDSYYRKRGSEDSTINCCRKNRHKHIDTELSHEAQLAGGISVCQTGLQEQVYDLRNCGPRHRFAVWNGKRFCIVSNCVQAISRDILCYAMRTLSHCFICGHVHDELIIEASASVELKAVCEQMGRVPPWLPGAVLRADGYECEFYMKD